MLPDICVSVTLCSSTMEIGSNTANVIADKQTLARQVSIRQQKALYFRSISSLCMQLSTGVRRLRGNSCCSILSHFTGQCIREPFHWRDNSAPPLLSPGCNRGGGPEPALPGLYLPQSRRDCHEPVLLTISQHLHHHPHHQDTGG